MVSLVLNICLLCFKTRYLLKLVNNDRSTIAARSADYLKSRREGSCRARSFKEIEEVATLVSCYNARWVTFGRLAMIHVRPGVWNSCSEGQRRTFITPRPRYDADPTMAVTAFTRNTLFILFPVMSYRQIISNRFFVRLKGTCLLASRELLNTCEKTK